LLSFEKSMNDASIQGDTIAIIETLIIRRLKIRSETTGETEIENNYVESSPYGKRVVSSCLHRSRPNVQACNV
jgi:hypothetical protein